MASFPDIEAALLLLLAPLAGGASHIATQTDPGLVEKLPFVRVYRFGGTDDGFTDEARVGVDAFAATRPGGYALAESLRQLLADGPHSVLTPGGWVVLDTSETGAAPVEVPYGDSRVRRWAADYRITARRPVGA